MDVELEGAEAVHGVEVGCLVGGAGAGVDVGGEVERFEGRDGFAVEGEGEDAVLPGYEAPVRWERC